MTPFVHRTDFGNSRCSLSCCRLVSPFVAGFCVFVQTAEDEPVVPDDTAIASIDEDVDAAPPPTTEKKHKRGAGAGRNKAKGGGAAISRPSRLSKRVVPGARLPPRLACFLHALSYRTVMVLGPTGSRARGVLGEG